MSLRLEWTLLLLLGALLAVPLWRVDFLPLTDLPQHLAILADLQRYDTDAGVQAAYSRSFFPSSNVLFHLLALGLAGVLPLETAVRVLLTGGFVAYAVVAGFAARAAGARPLAAALALPYALSYPFLSGYLNYWLAWPPLVAMWLLLDRRTRAADAAAAVLAALTFLAHLQVWGLGLAAPVVFAARAPRGERLRTLGRVAGVLAPSAALAGAYAIGAAADSGVGDWGLHSRWVGALDVLSRFWTWQLLVTAAEPANVVGVGLWVLGFGVAAVQTVRRRRLPLLAPLGLLGLAASLSLPEHLTNQYYVASRMLAPASWLLTMAVADGRRLPVLLGVGAVLAHVAAVDHAWQCTDAAARGLREVVAAADGDGRMLAITARREVPHLRNLAFLHAASFHTVDNGGEAAFSFALFESSPLRWREPGERVHLRPGQELRPVCAFLEDRLPAYRYVLVREVGDGCGLTRRVAPYGELRAAEGDWRLFRMTRALPAGDAPAECGC